MNRAQILESMSSRSITKRDLNSKYQISIIIVAGVNALIYSCLSYYRYEAFNAGVFDLGVSSTLMYGVFHGSFDISNALGGHLSIEKMIYLPLSVIYNIYPNQISLMVYQSIWLSFGAVAIYWISSKILKEEFTAFLIAVTYLLYYPMSSVYWFDFHFMAIFPTFFLLTVSAYLNNKRKLSVIFGVLAASTDLLAPVIIGILAIYFIFIDKKNNSVTPSKNWYGITLFFAAFAIFVFANLYLGPNVSTQYLGVGQGSPLGTVTNSITLKMGFFLRVTLPLLFLSFFSPSSLIITIPYFALAFKNNYPPYLSTMFYQYPALLAPPLFISAIFGLRKFYAIKQFKKTSFTLRKIAIVLFAINFLLASFYSPIGNLFTSGINSSALQSILTGTHGSYETAQNIVVSPNDVGLQKIATLVPKGSEVLIQNNMPQFTQGYKWLLPDGLGPYQSPQYILTDPYSNTFTHYSLYSKGNYTMYSAVDHLLSISTYGIYGQWNGSVLYKHNYYGNPIVYQGFSQLWQGSSFYFNNSYARSEGKTLEISNMISSKVGWYGPYSYLLPGNYTITLTVSASNVSPSNSFQFQVVTTNLDNRTQTILYSDLINGAEFSGVNLSQTFDLNFSVDRYYELVEYRSFYFKWDGIFILSSIKVSQNSYSD